LATVASFRPHHFSPVVGLQQGLSDPVSGLNMGQTAEVLAREFNLSREDQDAFALRSHQLAAAAGEAGRMSEEVIPVPLPTKYNKAVEHDTGIRAAQTMEALGKLRPVFDRRYGTVTAGNSSQITDGAAALVLASGRKARELGLPILGKIRSWAFAGCDPARMGLGPVLATPKALRRAGGLSMQQMDLVEINEAFASQLVHVARTLGIPDEKLNVNGGAIARGHPLGATGARRTTSLIAERERRDATWGVVSMCSGGGMGAAGVLQRL